MVRKFELREQFLKELVEAPSPSGFEQPAQKVWKRYLTGICDKVYGDLLGNAIGVLNERGNLRVMLSGHCDEIGLVIHYINEQGFLYCRGIIEPCLLPGQRVFIHTKKERVLGVVGKKPVHLMDEKEKNQGSSAKIHDLYIDIGAKNGDEARNIVAIGDPVTFAVGYHRLSNHLAVSRGFDDKIGSFIVGEVLRYLSLRKKHLRAGVFGVSSTQEEVGCRGIRPAAFDINPDIGIVLDVTFSSDTPDSSKAMLGDIKLGGGAVISKGGTVNPVLFEMLQEVAKEKKMPYQVSPSFTGAGTETYVVQLSRGGVATILVSIPNRYMHTPSEVVSLEDVKNIIVLLGEFILKLNAATNFLPQ